MVTRFKNILFISILLAACTTPRKYQKNKPFVFKNTIELNGGNFSADERNSLKQKLSTQLDDSMKLAISDFAFVLHRIKQPPAYDSGYAGVSARNMKNTLMHLGYYGATSRFDADTAKLKVLTYKFPFKFKIDKQERVSVKYTVDAGNPTLVDTISYRLQIPELQQLAIQTMPQSFLAKGKNVSKADVLAEISRLVELFRNNGYYKFTSDDLKVRGDTTIAALTSVSDDPFENIKLLAEANEKRNRPTIKLALVLNPAADSMRLKKYYINNIYIWPDFTSADAIGIAEYSDTTAQGYIIRYHKSIVRNDFLLKKMSLKKGDVYRQADYAKTIANFSKTGVWQNVNIQIVEVRNKDSVGKIDMIVQLVPSKKFGFETNIEASYSANSNSNNVNVANAGNLLGLSGNVSLQNRNVARQGIKMTNAIRAGVELNLNARPGSDNFFNSNELSFNNTISIPKLLYPFKKVPERKLSSQQTFFSTSIGRTDRIGLFKLNSFGFAMGYEFNFKPNQTLTIKPLNVEYSNLYDRSAAFDATINANPYLRYSFNTALVLGSTVGYAETHINPRHPNRISSFKLNFEESGALLYFAVPLDEISFLSKDLKKFIKLDVEKTWTITHLKSTLAFRIFGGVGIPIGKSDTTLPFFKQYFAGGPNSMRGWPIRGVGPGSKPLAAYGVRTLSDRTGDMRFEFNAEYRKDLFQIIPNTLILKWALFADVGNVWNFKNTNFTGAYDSTKFEFKNFYKQLGVNLGTGFRLDFNYVLLRFDLGFRFKRPELEANDGWKAPSIGFDDLFKKLFTAGPDEEYRKWRYENFNFSIGLTYPF